MIQVLLILHALISVALLGALGADLAGLPLVAPPVKVARTVIAPSGSALALMPATVTVVALAVTGADPVTVEPPLPTEATR